jgi:hypothetical protein
MAPSDLSPIRIPQDNTSMVLWVSPGITGLAMSLSDSRTGWTLFHHLEGTDAKELTTWLADEDTAWSGAKSWTGPKTKLTVRKRTHSMTVEDLVDVTITETRVGRGMTLVMTYPQTAELLRRVS